MELVHLLDALDPDAPLAQRHLWLIELLRWVRGDANDVQTSVARVRLLLDAAQARPEWLARWRRWWNRFTDTVDLTPLLADFGFAPRTAFLSEFGHRLRRKLLPGTPETTDLSELFGLLLPDRFDVRWIQALDTDTLKRLRALLLSAPEQDNAIHHWQGALLDALTFSISQVSATGFASEIRTRMSSEALAERHFHALPAHFEHLRRAVLTQGRRSEAAHAAAEQLSTQLEACREAAQTVYSHLEEHGVSVGIVFRLRQLSERILRIRQLLDCMLAEQTERATAALVADLVQIGQDNRSIRALIASSSHLTAAKVAERSAESGEHYITRDAAEYREMLGKAAGGGALIGLTTWVKFVLVGLGLSAFWDGFAAGTNYAFFFVLVQLLHLTVATKQPAVTAPAMVAKLREIRQPGAVRRFVDEVAHLLRSQIAAILGNVGLVVPVVMLISAGLSVVTGAPMIDAEKAHHVLHDLSLIGPTVLFAAFTGVLLFASSIVAGWVENWFVFHQLDSAMRHNPAYTRWLGRDRADRWATFMRANISGLAANISLGFMLGLVPAFAEFFGLGLEVRHVTLSAGQVAAAAMALGADVWSEPAFWGAVAGVVAVGPLNLAVSFYLAFRLALRAQNINASHRVRIYAAIRHRLRHAPLSFLLPPRADTEPPPDASDNALANDGVNRRRAARVGEFELIRRHFQRAASGPSVVLGIGDDCALLQPSPGHQLAMSSDMLVEGRHFFPEVSPQTLGHKALAVNLSDLAAMGARPLGFTLALALPHADDAWLRGFSDGLLALADAHACPLVGGDTTRGPLNICITVFGELLPGQALRRDAARPGDDLYLSGRTGEARLALERLRGTPWAPVATPDDGCRERLERPTPRLALGQALAGQAHAAIDVSDGLAGDLGHILRASGVGADIHLARLPIAPSLLALPEASRLECLLHGGDDYELLFTAPASARGAIAAASAASQTPVQRIGVITPQTGLRLVRANGDTQALSATGFDHFT